MIIYNLSKINKIIPSNCFKVTLQFNENTDIFVSDSLYFYLTKSKTRINDNVDDWDYYKKITNPYEFIHTPIYKNTRCVANYEAVSRSFYKMIEMVNFYKILDIYDHRSINTFHLAEGPGGFIEAMMKLRKNTSDTYHGMTLINDNRNVPRWTKLQHKFRFNSRIKYEMGKTGNGDLLRTENLQYCFNKYANSMDIITGDGGFDFSLNYEKQESTSTKLILAQILYALTMQRHNGTFILKIFDIFRKPTTQAIYILNCFYDNVSICKPKTSRFANSEKYIVCKNFKLKSIDEYFDKFIIFLSKINEKDQYIHSILTFEIPNIFIKEIEELNCILGKKQLNTIHATLLMIQEKRTDKIDKSIKINTDKCIQWCSNNNIPYYSSQNQGNIFTNNKKSSVKKNTSIL